MNNDEQIVDLILKESEKLENYLNKDLLVRFSKMHNVSEEENLFFLKQEVVAKNSYFLNVKKKYVLHIVNKEKVSVDKLFIKGLVTQRSDYPSITRNKIRRLCEILVKEEHKNKFVIVRQFVEDSRNELLKLCIEHSPTVARPVSFSKNIEDYTKIPPQIKAMNMWNDLMYHYFVRGTKGYLFKILGIDLNKAPEKVVRNAHNYLKQDSIAIPYEEEKLPDWIIVDVKKMMNFAWEDRINEFLKPIQHLVSEKKEEEIDLF